MDFSDIVQTPTQEPPEQEPTGQKKSYWQVLDEYGKASQQEPELAKLSVPQFAQKMNEVSGTNQYDEGLNDSWLRRLGAAGERGLRHFGGILPGEQWGGPTLSELFGGPRGGIDLPAAAKESASKAATGLGASPELAEKVGGGAEGLVKSIPTFATAMAAPEALALPVLAGGSAVETYGETGRVIPSIISGATAAAIPKVMDIAGQSALRAIGAKTAGELAPGLEPLARGDKLAQDVLDKYTPEAGWSPTALVQRGTRLGAAQIGMLGTSLAGEAAQTAVSPELTWQQKLKQIGEEFSPSSLVGTAISQLPFTALDVMHERSHPMKQIEGSLKSRFTNRFVEQAMKGDPETGSPGFIPSVD